MTKISKRSRWGSALLAGIAVLTMLTMASTAASAKPSKKPDTAQPTTDRGATTDGGSTGVKGNSTATPTTGEKGIKDNGVKQCGKCGVTSGRVKANEGTQGEGEAPPSVERGHKDNTVPGGGTGKRGHKDNTVPG